VSRKSDWAYLSYVPVGEFWAEFKGALGAWLVISGISLVVGLAIQVGNSAVVKTIGFHSVPRWVILTVATGGFLWFMRGKEISWKIPDLPLLQTGVVAFLLGASFFAFENLRWWVAVLLFWAVAIAVLSADRLASKGRQLAMERNNVT
jgi:hypothetical protein